MNECNNEPKNEDLKESEDLKVCPRCGGCPIEIKGIFKHCSYCDLWW